MSVPKSTVIIGAGATGALTASLLSRNKSGTKITVWDKARGAGGRMSTHRRDSGPAHFHVDMGAQYITRYNDSRSQHDSFEVTKDKIFLDLLDNDILVPFCGTIEGIKAEDETLSHYVSPNGLSSIPRYYLTKSGANVQYGCQLESMDINGDLVCLTSTNGSTLEAESVILTLPVPQCLALKGNFIQHVSPKVLQDLRQVVYSSRYALGLFFDKPVPETGWTGKYFDHTLVRYACWDTLKYTKDRPHPLDSTLLVHSSVPYGLQALEEDKDSVQKVLTSAINELIPNLPPPSHTHLIRWRYSQLYKGYPGSPPGHVLLCHHPLIILTGDAFTHSNFEGCVEAAASVVARLQQS